MLRCLPSLLRFPFVSFAPFLRAATARQTAEREQKVGMCEHDVRGGLSSAVEKLCVAGERMGEEVGARWTQRWPHIRLTVERFIRE